MLVLDASTSMLELVAPARTKRDAATDAARRFLDLLKPRDQAGIAYFNDRAVLLQELTSDRAALSAALDLIENRQFTRLDLGIAVGAVELASPRHRPGNRPVLVLLTDGKANPEPVESALAEADRAKAAGVTLFVIGLGRPEDLDDAALRQIATVPDFYHQTSDAAALAAIYEEIAGTIPCSASSFWGRR
jgi:Mg-chelatase subunit ChlD